MLLFYLRHGHPTYNPDELTPLGHRQAEALAKRLALYGIDEVYASSSKRAVQTAQPTCEILRKEPTILDWCNEHHAWLQLTVGDEKCKRWLFQDKEIIELFASDEIKALGDDWYKHPRFDGMPTEAGIGRIRVNTEGFIRSLGYERCGTAYKAVKPNNRRIALFAHQGFGLAFLSALLGIPYTIVCTRFDMSYTGMTVIQFEGDGLVIPKVLQLSNDSHLYRDGLPTDYNNEIKF